MSAFNDEHGSGASRTRGFLPVPWRVVGLLAILLVLGIAVTLNLSLTMHPVLGPLAVVGSLAFLTPGVILLLRRDWHVVGWALCLFGVSMSFAWVWEGVTTSNAWLMLLREAFQGPLFWFPMLLLVTAFPEGLSHRTRIDRLIIWLGGALSVGGLLGRTVTGDGSLYAPNPLGVGFLPEVVATDLLTPFQLVLLGVAFGRLVRRHRIAGPATRRQYRWVMLAAALLLASVLGGVVGNLITGTEDGWWWYVAVGTYVVFPFAFLFAITRYRLYEIDRIISRTVSYVIVVGSLVALFFAVVVGLQAVLPTGSSSLVVAGSTLAVAALFSPLRRRVQSIVDRRFNRTRYDAEQVVDRMVGELRDSVEVGEIVDLTAQVIDDVFGPRSMAVWVGPVGRNGPSPARESVPLRGER